MLFRSVWRSTTWWTASARNSDRRRGARRGDLPGAAPVTVELIQGLLVAFAIVVILMNPYIRLLRFVGMGKQINVEGPDLHQVKQGTPTMGGLLIVGVVLVLFGILRGDAIQGGIIPPLATLLLVGLLGAFAFLYPDAQVSLYFLFPMSARTLA